MPTTAYNIKAQISFFIQIHQGMQRNTDKIFS